MPQLHYVSQDKEPHLKLGSKPTECNVPQPQDVHKNQYDLQLRNLETSFNVSAPQEIQRNELNLTFNYDAMAWNVPYPQDGTGLQRKFDTLSKMLLHYANDITNRSPEIKFANANFNGICKDLRKVATHVCEIKNWRASSKTSSLSVISESDLFCSNTHEQTSRNEKGT